MTVSTTLDRQYFNGDGANVNFPFNFKFLDNSHIFVWLIGSDGTVTPQTLTTNYTLSGLGNDAGGTVTMLVAPPLTVPATRVLVQRVVPQTQPTSIRNQGKFFPELHENVFDRLTMMIQQALSGLANALQLDQTGSRWDFKGFRGINAADPVNAQDVVTKNWLGLYIDGISGLINTTVGIAYDAGTLFDYLRFGVNRTVDTIAALRLLAGVRNRRAFVLGYYTPIDGGGGAYWYDPSDTTSADNGGTIIVAADGGRWKLAMQESVTSKTFGAKGDKVTDDTVRLQAYITWCSSFTLWKPMVIEGVCLVTASLIVNRLVDTTLSEWRVIAANAESGFLQNTAFTLFESSISMPGVDPVCEAITFENIRFEAGAAAGAAYILTKKFLRMKFLNCYFYKIRLLVSVTYIQSFYFSNCNIRFWPGIFIIASHAFDTHFVQVQSEFGAGFLTNFANGSYNLTFTDGLHEGSGGGLVSGGGFRQLKIDGYYLEQNATVDIDLSGGVTNWEVSIRNSIFASTPANVANVNFYNIVWGPTYNAIGGGNYHTNGRLHDNSGLAAGGLLREAAGDIAAITSFKTPISVDGANGTFTITNTLGTGTQNYANWSRRGNMVRVEFSYTFVGASGSNAVLIGLPAPAANPLVSGFVNYSDYVATAVRIAGGTGFAVTASATRFAPISDIAGAGITYTALAGKTIVAEMEYRV